MFLLIKLMPWLLPMAWEQGVASPLKPVATCGETTLCQSALRLRGARS